MVISPMTLSYPNLDFKVSIFFNVELLDSDTR